MRTDYKGNPWKGLASYTYEDAEYFYGRDQELRDISIVIKQNAFTTLYGISGAGKTSIINAGLIPILDKQSYLPIYIRLDHNSEHVPYDEQIINAVEEALHSAGGETEDIVGHSFESEYDKLWLYFHSNRFWSNANHILIPIIFIDQFEEIFTKNEETENIWAFFNVIDSLQYSVPTDRILRTIDNTETFISFGEDQNFRFVFSMREDFLARLEDYSYDIPSLRKNRIGLKPLNGLQALDVILSPKPDIVNKKVALHIISKIVGRNVQDNRRRLEATSVDTSMLSLFCTELYNYAMEDPKGEITIQLVDLYGENILDWFYDRNMQILPKQTYVYLENQLLTHSGFRNSVAMEDLLQNGVLQSQLDLLAENRIIRIEDVNHNMRVEFTHDVLCKIAKKRKDARDKIAKMKGEESALRAFTIDNVIIFIALVLFVLSTYYVGIDSGVLIGILSFPILLFLYAIIVGRSIADFNLSKIIGIITLVCGTELLLATVLSVYDKYRYVENQMFMLIILILIPMALFLLPYLILIKNTLQHKIKSINFKKYLISFYMLFVILQTVLLAMAFKKVELSGIVFYLIPTILLSLFPFYSLIVDIKEGKPKVFSTYTIVCTICILSFLIFRLNPYIRRDFSAATIISLSVIWIVFCALSIFYAIQYMKTPKRQNILNYFNDVLNFQVFIRYKSFERRLQTIIICFVIIISSVAATIYWDWLPFITLPLGCVLALHVGCSEFKLISPKTIFSLKIIPIIVLCLVIVGCQYAIGELKMLAIYLSALAITIIVFVYLIYHEQIRKRYFFAARVLLFSIVVGFVLPILCLGYNVFNPSFAHVSRVWNGKIPTNVRRVYLLYIENKDGKKGVMDYSEILLEPKFDNITFVEISQHIFESVYPIRAMIMEFLDIRMKDHNYEWDPVSGRKYDFVRFFAKDKGQQVILDDSLLLSKNNKYGRAHVKEWLTTMKFSSNRKVNSQILNKNNKCITEDERIDASIKLFASELDCTLRPGRYRYLDENFEPVYNNDSHMEKVIKQCYNEATLMPLLKNADSLDIHDIYKVSMDLDYLFACDKSGHIEAIILDSLWKVPVANSYYVSEKAYLYMMTGNTDQAIKLANEILLNILPAKSSIDSRLIVNTLITLCISTYYKINDVEISDALYKCNIGIIKELTEIDSDYFYDSLKYRLEALEAYGIYIDRTLLHNTIMSILENYNIQFLTEKTGRDYKEKMHNDSILRVVVDNVSFNLIKVVGGDFRMGTKDGNKDEAPIHPVTLNDYYIAETEVTQELWNAVMNNNPSYFLGNMQNPVECVSWSDCQLFVSRLNKKTGMNFKLPTEAQWEYAARGGSKSQGYIYSGSEAIEEVAWFEGNENKMPHPVKQSKPNELGIYDMSGNVWEWCADRYDAYYYFKIPTLNPENDTSSNYFVYRGGSWGSPMKKCRVGYRNKGWEYLKSNGIGLRLVLY